MSDYNRGWTKGPDSNELYVEAMEAKAQSELAPARGWDTEQKTNMKTYEVTIEACRVVLVEANTEEEALELADDETSMGSLELDASYAKEISGKELESAKRHNKLIRANG